MPRRRARGGRNARNPQGRTARARRFSPWSSPSHTKDAEGGLFARRVAGGREPEREDATSVERVDDPIVPEARSREIGVPFALVGLANLVLVDVADDREDRGRLLSAHDRDARV